MIALFTKRHNPVTYHRLRPFAKLGLDYYWIKDGLYTKTTHLITNNAFYPVFQEEIKAQKEKIGFKFIFDVDDYWIIDPWNPVYKEMQGKNLQARIDTMKMADVITCTHDRLATKIREINPTAEIVIVPNALDHTDPQWKPAEIKDVSYGYIAGPTHKRDIDALKGVQRKIDILSPTYFRAKLQSKSTFPYTPQHKYGYLYNKFSVSLAPIYPTEFSSLKSDIKAVEAGFKNRMLVASNHHPYLDNPNIKTAETYTEWNAIAKLTKPEVEDWAAKLHEWATTHRKLEEVNKIRTQLLST